LYSSGIKSHNGCHIFRAGAKVAWASITFLTDATKAFFLSTTDAFYGRKEKPKKQKQVEVKHKPSKSMFEDTEDSRHYEDYSDLGIDIPKGDDW